MTKYLISFNDGAMVFPAEDFAAIADAAHAVVREAKAAGVWVFGAGLLEPATTSVVHTDGSVTDGPAAGVQDFVGGFSIVDVPTRADALAWAAKIAVACRCSQDVREIMDDPEA